MEQQPRPIIPFVDRARFVVYGMAGGLLVGIIVGWMLHGLIGLLLRLLLLVAILIPVVAAIFFWQKVNSDRKKSSSSALVTDAQWREMETKPRPTGGAKR